MGNDTRLEVDDRKKRWGGEPFFPNHIIKQFMIFLAIVFALVALSTLMPVSLEEKADPFVTPEHIKPEWYFLAVYQALKFSEKLSTFGSWVPELAGMIGQFGAILLMFLVPFLDKNPSHRPADRKRALALGVLAMIGFVVLSIWGRYS